MTEIKPPRFPTYTAPANLNSTQKSLFDSVDINLKRSSSYNGDSGQRNEGNTNGYGQSEDFVIDNILPSQVLGEGSFGTVKLANYMEDIVAVKYLRTKNDGHIEDNTLLEQKLLREANLLAGKRSAHIVRLLHYNSQKKMIVTEFCENGSLYEVLREESKRHIALDWTNRLKWIKEVALGMHVMHNEPPAVLHRDIKSSNIFLDANYKVKIGDFGLSKILRNEYDVASTECLRKRTMTWQPPEVICSATYSTKSDVYSFGIVMYEVLTLNFPYGLHSSDPHVDIRAQNIATMGEGLGIPDDRSTLPGTWHHCLEAYIDLMNECTVQNPRHRPEFGQISRRLKEIEKQFKRSRNAVPGPNPTASPQRPRPVLKTLFALAQGFCLIGLMIHAGHYRVSATLSEK